MNMTNRHQSAVVGMLVGTATYASNASMATQQSTATCLTTAAATALWAYSNKNVKKPLGNTPAKPKILCDNNLRAQAEIYIQSAPNNSYRTYTFICV